MSHSFFVFNFLLNAYYVYRCAIHVDKKDWANGQENLGINQYVCMYTCMYVFIIEIESHASKSSLELAA